MVGPAPTFSFLTTAYRTERVLGETIASVRAQTRTDWELVVVDNGPSDAVAAVVRAHRHDPRIRLVRRHNRGYSAGVTAAAAAARGRVFCVLDSDDLLTPEYCARTGTILDHRPDVAAVGCDAVLFDDADGADRQGYLESIRTRRPPPGGRALSLTDLLAGCVPHYTGAIRREAWTAAGGYAADPDVEPDVVLWLRLAAAGHGVWLLPDRLVRCRLRPDSASRDPAGVEAFEERLQASFFAVPAATGSPAHRAVAEATLRRLRYHQCLRRARRALLDGDVPTARGQAHAAFAQQHTARAAAVTAAVYLAPTLLRRAQPVKQRLTRRIRTGAGVP